MSPHPQIAAAFQRAANAQSSAAASDRYTAEMLYAAYNGLMTLYHYELNLEFQLRAEAERDKAAARAAQQSGAWDAAVAAALRAQARSLAAAAAAAKREAATAVAKYNADLRAYQAGHRRTANKPKKPNLAAFRHTLHCLFDPGALLTRPCAKIYKQGLAIAKQIDHCNKNGATARECKGIWELEDETDKELTHCTYTSGTQVCTETDIPITEGNGSLLFDLLRLGAEFVSGFCDAVTDGACTLATVVISISNSAIDISK